MQDSLAAESSERSLAVYCRPASHADKPAVGAAGGRRLAPLPGHRATATAASVTL